MKLGSETGSVINHLQSRMVKNAPEPEVGMGVTFLHWTDRSPGTVVAWDPKTGILEVTGDSYKRVDKNGFSESQGYEYTTNWDAPRSFYKRLPDGRWQNRHYNEETKRWRKGTQGIYVGKREKYHDFSF